VERTKSVTKHTELLQNMRFNFTGMVNLHVEDIIVNMMLHFQTCKTC